MGDKEEVACFVPGRTYVNGADNLLKFGRSQELLAAILDPDLDIKVQYFVKAILDILITCVGERLIRLKLSLWDVCLFRF